MQDLGEDIELERIEGAIDDAKGVADRPSLIMLRTHIGYGAPNTQDTDKAHGSPLGEEEVGSRRRRYGWPTRADFLVPDEALEHFREAAAARR